MKKKDIAVIGISFRFPGANNQSQFWENLSKGIISIDDIPIERWNYQDYQGDPNSDYENLTNSTKGGFIDHVDKFDAPFFNISKKEAELMDPQQRLMLELTQECFEDACLPPEKIRDRRVGVYLGVFNSDYKELQETKGQLIDAYHATGTSPAIIANRISNFFNFTGESIVIDTACSGSLFSLHAAVQSLRTDNCSLALTGAVNLLLTPTRHISFAKTGMLSPTGAIKAFDAKADGYVRGEGAAILLLKPLIDAKRDCNKIYGVIKGCAVNHSGKTKTLTYPSALAQAEVISLALKDAQVKANTLTYFEAHGTGTPKGDPIEFQGILGAFKNSLSKKDYLKMSCLIGTVKPNIGHLEACSGFAGIIKVFLAMKNRTIPPLAKIKELNPLIDIKGSPFSFNEKPLFWKRKKWLWESLPRRAGVSSFGFGGTNGHVILEEYKQKKAVLNKPFPYYLSLLSAKSKQALLEKMKQLRDWLIENPSENLHDISFTLMFGRSLFRYRYAVVVQTQEELIATLSKDFNDDKKILDLHGNNLKTLSKIILKNISAIPNNIKVSPLYYKCYLNEIKKVFYCKVKVDWNYYFKNIKYNPTSLPTYPFQKKSYWYQEFSHSKPNSDFSGEYVSGWRRETSIAWDPVERAVAVNVLPEIRSHLEIFSNDIQCLELKNESDIDEIVRAFQQSELTPRLIWGLQDNQDWDLRKNQKTIILCLKLIKALLGNGYGKKIVDVICLTESAYSFRGQTPQNPFLASFGGLFKTLGKEQRKWNIYLFDIEKLQRGASLTDFPNLPSIQHIFRSGVWYREVLHPFVPTREEGSSFVTSGNYVIIGGAGGIGSSITRHLIRTYKAKVIWIGRRSLNASIQEKINALNDDGNKPIYYSANVADEKSLDQVFSKIMDRFHKVDGLIYSAATLVNSRIELINVQDFDSILSEKINSLVNIGKLAREYLIDKMIFFSSLNVFITFPGYASYTSACSFLDSYVFHLAEKLKGRNSIKLIHWGHWTGVGALSKVENFEDWASREGIIPIQADEGVSALDAILNSKAQQMTFFKVADPSLFSIIDLSSEILELPKRRVYLSISELVAQYKMTKMSESSIDALDGGLYFHDNALLAKVLLKKIQDMGLQSDTPYTLDEAFSITGITPFYKKWFSGAMNYFFDYNLIFQSDGHLVVKNINNTEVFRFFDAEGAQYELLKTVLDALPKILRGQVTGTEVIFTNGNSSLVKGVYSNNVISDFFNEVVSKLVCLITKKGNSKEGGLRILELGAGTGGISDAVIEAIQEANLYVKEYVYTDISHQFLRDAESRYKRINWISYKILNIELAPEEQGFEMGRFDLVLAGNVLHATRNIANTLMNVKKLLFQDGYLLLHELTTSSLFLHTIFGLLDGWWLSEDPEIRLINSPILSVDSWKSELCKMGFHSVEALGSPIDMGQHVLLGASDGLVARTKKELRENIKIEPLSILKHDSKPALKKSDVEDQVQIQIELENIIKKELSEIIGLDINEIDIRESFSDYGLDSISGIKLIHRMNEIFHCNLSSSLIFDYSSVERLTLYFLGLGVEMPIQNVRAESKDAIAIVGISGQFSTAKNVDEIWDAIKNSKELVRPVKRWPLLDILKMNLPNKSAYCYSGGLLENITYFDANFFNISALESQYMDPQQRIFLQHCWHALEDAAYAGTDISGLKCGVYVGCHSGDYQKLYNQDIPAQSFWGSASAMTPARIAYYLDLHGPAISIDTACSSSLLAIHLACQALKNNQMDMALAGGVFIQCTPDFFTFANRANMLSESGHCYPFDERADGFVPGEGAGVLVLKRLADAKLAGDHIYGIILGSAANQDGRTNGITAPSALMQEHLMVDLYQTLDLSPRDIQFMEAHGTATPLGDPIEFRGLKQAFEKFTQEKNYCALGSIKGNIGHAAEAAGVAGIIKILLSFKNRLIPPTINYENSNREISPSDSPFYINSKSIKWDIPENSKRRAAISSFGFSGTNVHMILEEGEAQKPSHIDWPAYPFVLSALTEDALRKQADQMIQFLSQHKEIDLGNMCFSLLVGRKHLDYRLAALVRNNNELQDILVQWFKNGDDSKVLSNCVSIENRMTHPSRLKVESSIQAFHDSNCQDIKPLYSLLALFMEGVFIDFNKLFHVGFSRLSLPKYPFSKDSYWINDCEKLPNIHWRLQGFEYFFEDHVIDKRKILPATIYIEKILREFASLFRKIPQKDEIIFLKEVFWLNPVHVINLEFELTINFSLNQDKSVSFSFSSADAPKKISCCEGKISLENPKFYEKSTNKIDFDQFQLLMDKRECYERYRSRGIEYGSSFQSIHAIYNSKFDDSIWIFIKNSLLKESAEEGNIFIGSLVDSALQGIIAFFEKDQEFISPRPFHVERIVIWGDFKDEMWAQMQLKKMSLTDCIVDLKLYSDEGSLILEINNFTFRLLQNTNFHDPKLAFYRNCWLKQAATTPFDRDLDAVHKKIVFTLNMRSLTSPLETDNYVSNEITVRDKLRDYTKYLIKKLQYLKNQYENQKIFLQIIIADGNSDSILGALGAFLKTAELEDSNLITQLIKIDSNLKKEEVVHIINEARENVNCKIIRCIGKLKTYESFEPVSLEGASHTWGNGEVTLITGGLGAIGRMLVEDIIKESPQSIIILLGRKPLSLEQASWLGQFDSVSFLQVDISNRSDLHVIVDEIMSRHNRIDNVFHIAGQLRDSFIANKSPEQVDSVFSSKVNAVHYLDEITQNIKLKYFVLFSSISSKIGNIGQSDYATANAFLNIFARNRNSLVKEGKRSGRTISISWPHWEAGGMVLPTGIKQVLLDRYGLLSLSTETALLALKKIMSLGLEDTLVFYGDQSKFEDQFKLNNSRKNLLPISNQDFSSNLSLAEIKNIIKTIFSKVTKIPIEQLNEDSNYNVFGLDSLMMIDIANLLDVKFGKVSKTLLFEYGSINELAQYFQNNSINSFTKQFISIDSDSSDIAIIGLAGKYPESPDLESFWHNLKNGINCITDVPINRWDPDLFNDVTNLSGAKANLRQGGFIKDPTHFDPLFFNISPLDAEKMDPQERVFLQCAYEAIEDAGYAGARKREVGVFVGVMYHDYELCAAEKFLSENRTFVSNSVAAIANRVSYHMDFTGPSLAIDSMCSSSLTAIYLACQSIKNNECVMALAGGVNLSLHPSKFISLAQNNFLSTNGRCVSYGDGGDGYVPSEGVGVVVLKTLHEAERDGDQIYGIIRAVKINHGGRVSGYTVPNPKAQTELIQKCLIEAKIDPCTISYIEGHGTGTPLGDPIELNALKNAYKVTDNFSCSIGSVKSNIGHCESAAGIAGLTKILLQMKHKFFVPSLHAKIKNPNINFDDLPFKIQYDYEPWESNSIRRAAISSFGAGGSNAHMIVEEYIDTREIITSNSSFYIFVLSARNSKELLKYAKNVDHFLSINVVDFESLIYTFQCGRESHPIRLAIVVKDMRDLKNKLKTFVENPFVKEGIYFYLNENPSEKVRTLLASKTDLNKLILDWYSTENYTELSSYWVEGLFIDWSKFYAKHTPKKISLPTYPFTLKEYPLPIASNNTFYPRLSGEAWFVQEHVINGEKLLPGVVCFKLISDALLAQGNTGSTLNLPLEIRNVTWMAPINFLEVKDLSVKLNKSHHGHYFVNINKEQHHSKILCLSSEIALKKPFNFRERPDLVSVKSRCSRWIDKKSFYSRLEIAGYEYGPSLQRIQNIYLGEQELVAELSSVINSEGALFEISTLDAALQSVFLLFPELSKTLWLPYFIDSLLLYKEAERAHWIVVSRADGDKGKDSLGFNIDLFDNSFELVASMQNLSCRQVSRNSEKKTDSLYLLSPRWVPDFTKIRQNHTQEKTLVLGNYELDKNRKESFSLLNPLFSTISLSDSEEQVFQKIKNELHEIKQLLILIRSDEFDEVLPLDIIRRQEEGVFFVLRLIKAILRNAYDDKSLFFTLVHVTADPEARAIHSGIHGLVSTLANEYPHWPVNLLALPESEEWPVLDFFALGSHHGKLQIYKNNQWYHLKLQPHIPSTPASEPYVENGVYVIIGGAGGLGRVLTEKLIRDYNAQCIWIGRKEITHEIRERLSFFSRMGKTPCYFSVDTSDNNDLKNAYFQIIKDFPEIDGVIHSSLQLSDHSLKTMTIDAFQKVYRAKVDSLVNTYEVFSRSRLKFFLVFSSLISFTANPGQSNYGAASTFVDAYSSYLSNRHEPKIRIMNWGYWGYHGAVATESFRRRMLSNGIGSIEPQEGMHAIDILMSGQEKQLILAKLDPQKNPLEFLIEEDRSGGLYLEDEDQLIAKILLLQLKAIGLESHYEFTINEFLEKLRINHQYFEWSKFSIQFLVQAGLIQTLEGNNYCLSSEKNIDITLWDRWVEALNQSKKFVGKHTQLKLLDMTLRKLPEILQGKESATQVLFPEASVSFVKNIYSNNFVSDLYNKMVADAVVNFIGTIPNSHDAIKIIEIGAGTGSTTNFVISRLRALKINIGEYRFSDLSHAFLREAEVNYPEINWMRYSIFDVQKDPAAQGLKSASYDLVIASNVLHATRNIRQALLNVKNLLKDTGSLILNEISDISLFSHLTFGLLKEWWHADDKEFRLPGSPGLSVMSWKKISEELGFSLEQLSESHSKLGQSVMILKNCPFHSEGSNDWIRAELSSVLKVDENEIDDDHSFADYGLDSISGVSFVHEINKSLKEKLSPTAIFDYNTINRLSEHIQKTNAVKQSPVESKSIPVKTKDDEKIAIIGISGQFASAENLELFWKGLLEGSEFVQPIKRWSVDSLYSPQSIPGQSYCSSGGLFDHIEHFDPEFFNIPGTEAQYMDPQQRVFLQHSWNALEDAGYASENFSGNNCGIFVGCCAGDYSKLFSDTPPPSAFWGNAGSIIPARIAYYLDLHGPAIALDTACSSSLVAIHLACQSLKNKEVETALAGGVFIQSTPAFYQASNSAGMLSTGGHSYAFDSRADGFVPGEGVGVVLLKRLSDALRDRDNIYAVITTSGMNQDGMTNGITAPSSIMQEQLITRIYKDANISVEDIQVLEAHGTATKLGDPIEFKALKNAFERYSKRRNFCALGSVKANIGHTINAAGVAGLLKLILALKYKKIPLQINYETQNPEINIINSPFYINTKTKDWAKSSNGKRMAAISSFGFSGTNVHLVLEEAPNLAPISEDLNSEYPILISAMSENQLKESVDNFIDYLSIHHAHSCRDISHTLQNGRKIFSHKVEFMAKNTEEIISILKRWKSGEEIEFLKNSDREKNNEKIANRVSLPTYPFLRRKFWVGESPAEREWLILCEELEDAPLSLDGYNIKEAIAERKNSIFHVISNNLSQREAFNQALQNIQKIYKLEVDALFYSYDQYETLVSDVRSGSLIFILMDSQREEVLIQEEVKLVFMISQRLMQNSWTTPIKLICHSIFNSELGSISLSALSGFMNSAMLENPKHQWQFVIDESGNDYYLRYQILLMESLLKSERQPVYYKNNVRYVKKLLEITEINSKIPFKVGGVYLLAGGLGPLGEMLCLRLAEDFQAKLLVLSRSDETVEIREKLKSIRDKGGAIHYFQVDVTDKEALSVVFKDINQKHGNLNGVIHMARSVHDNLITNKSWSEFQETCKAKVEGSYNLDLITAEHKLDFFVFFSSMAAFGIKGSADYGFSSAFQNEYANYREALVADNKRHGKTLSLCWGPWTVDKYIPHNRDALLQEKGFSFIDMKDDFGVITKIFGLSPSTRGAMLITNKEKVKNTFDIKIKSAFKDPIKNKLSLWKSIKSLYEMCDLSQLRDDFKDYSIEHFTDLQINLFYELLLNKDEVEVIKKDENPGLNYQSILTGILKEYLVLEKIDSQKTFTSYGIDSVLAVQIAVKLEKMLNIEIKPNWLIDYPSVDALSNFLNKEVAR